MTRGIESPELQLPRNAFLRVRGGRDVVVALREGCLWITQPGWARDVMLAGGESYRIDVDGLVLLQATQPARLALLAGGLWQRVALEAHGDQVIEGVGPPPGVWARVLARLGVFDYGVSVWDMRE